jgi:hypothetical protein
MLFWRAGERKYEAWTIILRVWEMGRYGLEWAWEMVFVLVYMCCCCCVYYIPN